MKRYFVILLALAGVVLPLTAQNIDCVFVKGGSMFEGYISMQEPGTSVVVAAEKAILVVPSENIHNLKLVTKPIADLPVALRNWAYKNRPEEETLEVASLKLHGAQYENVLVLEKGSKYKLLSFEKRNFTFKWSDIVKTNKNESYYKNNPSIRDVVTLKNGKRYSGVVVEQVIGQELKIKHEKNSVETIRYADVMSIHTECLGDKADMWKQLPLLDKIELKDGTSLVGFISSRMFGKNILFLSKKSDVERIVDLKEIAKYHKIVNSQYEVNTVESKVEPSVDGDSQEATTDAPNAKVRKSRWEEGNTEPNEVEKKDSPKEEQTEPRMGITINGKTSTLNLVQTKDDIHYLIYDIVDIVPHGRNIRINLPISLRSEGVKVIKLRSYDVVGVDNKSLFGWTDDDAESFSVKAFSIDPQEGIDGRWNIEIKSEDIAPGVYALLPLINATRCVVFRVKP